MVVDTMVFAYALLRGIGFERDAADALEATDEILVPDSFRAEFANVVWQWLRTNRLSIERGLEALSDVEALLDRVVPANELWAEALALAAARNHPAYDTLFIALAERENTRVITFDRRMIERFPERAVAVPIFLGR
jgi:predicted nucleic acid-binding protein